MKRLTLYSSLIFIALNVSPFGVNLSRADEGSTVTHSEINWSELAIKDVDAAYQLSVINHPGMHDVRNPGFAKVILPIKVYVNRPRKKGFYYQPDIKFNELEWTTQALVKMIAEL